VTPDSNTRADEERPRCQRRAAVAGNTVYVQDVQSDVYALGPAHGEGPLAVAKATAATATAVVCRVVDRRGASVILSRSSRTRRPTGTADQAVRERPKWNNPHMTCGYRGRGTTARSNIRKREGQARDESDNDFQDSSTGGRARMRNGPRRVRSSGHHDSRHYREGARVSQAGVDQD
jgi:hypothetical protein